MLTDMILFRATLNKNAKEENSKFEQARREVEAVRLENRTIIPISFALNRKLRRRSVEARRLPQIGRSE